MKNSEYRCCPVPGTSKRIHRQVGKAFRVLHTVGTQKVCADTEYGKYIRAARRELNNCVDFRSDYGMRSWKDTTKNKHQWRNNK